MARIRTIKPEFPQSESMGRVSRDARLAFVELWTIADDEGRLRGNSRMLASLLFPYDDDAPGLIDSWLGELDREDCIRRYKIGGDTYLQICNWLNHQKIDHASTSKIPPFDESSRILASPREHSRLDQGSRTKDQGLEGTKDQGPGVLPAAVATVPAKKAAVSDAKQPAKSAAIWHAYSTAYRNRYGAFPVDNQKTRSQLCLVVDRLGADEAPAVAAFYVGHNGQWYVKKAHGVGSLLDDAEKLHMEWSTNRTVTDSQARQADRTQGQANIWSEIIAEERDKERAINER